MSLPLWNTWKTLLRQTGVSQERAKIELVRAMTEMYLTATKNNIGIG